MKKFLSIISISIFLVLVSCTKVIDLEVKDDSQKFVIEGFIENGTNTHHVIIKKTIPIGESNVFPAVSNAVVTVTDNLGNSGTFVHVADGKYELTNYTGVPGRTYVLTVVVDGQTFTAQSTMPSAVQYEELSYEFFGFGPDTIISVTPVRLDPLNEENFYYFRPYINDTLVDAIYLQTDQFNNGNLAQEPLFIPELIKGDSIYVEMFGIEKQIWTYYNQLLNNTSGQATPANPTTNFTGGCLGYFSARTKDVRGVKIPD